NKNTEIERLNYIYETLLESANVKLFRAQATLLSETRAQIDGQEISFDSCLIATGAKPVRPDIPGQELGVVSDDLFYLEELPEDIIVIGGGYIGVEFCGIFNALGSRVQLLYRRADILRGFDDDVRKFLHHEMVKKGVNIHTDTSLRALYKEGDKTVVDCGDTTYRTNLVVFATGRQPELSGLFGDGFSLACDQSGKITIDGHYRTSVPHIFALGDVASQVQLTPLAIAQAMQFVDQQYGMAIRPNIDYHMIPSAVFSQPPIGSIGFTEEQARAEFGALDIYESSFRPMRHTLSQNVERAMMKLIVAQKTDRVVGLHMVGEDAGEIVQGFAVAIQMGATKADFDRTLAIHPTAAEEFVTMRDKRT
ncbi:MAG: FAD-dependent oxidoreductase, partial [Pseudomonadota bacterium]